MNLRIYFSMVSFNRKFAVLLLVQVIFLSGIGAGVYTYDQFFPDVPLGNDQFSGSTITSDNIIHWIERTVPDEDGEVNPNLLDVLNNINIVSMTPDNKISKFTLIQEQNNHKGFLLRSSGVSIQAFQDEIIVVVHYKEYYQFPILFRIAGTSDNVEVEVSVLELPHQSSLIDINIDPNTGEVLLSSVGLNLWTLWLDLWLAAVTPDQFLTLLGSQHYNQSTYISQFQINELLWKDISSQLPFQALDIIDPIYGLSWDDGPQPPIVPNYPPINDAYRQFSQQVDDLDPEEAKLILETELIETYPITELIDIPRLYIFTDISKDALGRIHGQGTLGLDNQINMTISRADYFVVDINNMTQWSWDLTDTPLITPVFNSVSTVQLGNSVMYLNHDAGLDLRLDEEYPFENYDNFLSAYLNDDRDTLQLSVFNPTEIGSNRSLNQIGNYSIQPDTWINIVQRNFVISVERYSSSSDESIYFPTISIHTSLKLFQDLNRDYHLHFAFGDVPNQYDTSNFIHNTAIYSYDLNLNNTEELQDDIGKITVLREHKGKVYDPSLMKHGFPMTVHVREANNKQELLYFYSVNNNAIDFLPIASNFVKIVTQGGKSDE